MRITKDELDTGILKILKEYPVKRIENDSRKFKTTKEWAALWKVSRAQTSYRLRELVEKKRIVPAWRQVGNRAIPVWGIE